jgi:hypothetical protein
MLPVYAAPAFPNTIYRNEREDNKENIPPLQVQTIALPYQPKFKKYNYPGLVIGKSAWENVAFKIVEEIPVPSLAALNQLDPFFKKNFCANYAIFYLPKEVCYIGKNYHFTFNALEIIAKSLGIPHDFSKISKQDQVFPAPGWYALSTEPIPFSLNRFQEDQFLKIVSKEFQIPNISLFCLFSLMTYSIKNIFIFGEDTFTRCGPLNATDSYLLGGFSEDGLEIKTLTSSLVSKNIGMAVQKKL